MGAFPMVAPIAVVVSVIFGVLRTEVYWKLVRALLAGSIYYRRCCVVSSNSSSRAAATVEQLTQQARGVLAAAVSHA